VIVIAQYTTVSGSTKTTAKGPRAYCAREPSNYLTRIDRVAQAGMTTVFMILSARVCRLASQSGKRKPT
jgi:hypothetical protein